MKSYKFFTIAVIFFLTFSCMHHDKSREEKLSKAEPLIDEIMEAMDLPEYGVVKLIRRDAVGSKDFADASRDLIKHGRRLKAVDHPDKKFNDFTVQMLEAFDKFEKALASKDKESIKTAWKNVDKTCVACHDVYD